MSASSARESQAPLLVSGLGSVDYQRAWDIQRTLAEDRAAGRGSDTLLLLQHPSVYTAGRRTAEADRPTDGTPVIDVDRGGKITWHGPGQLVGYPIVKLASPIDVVAYVRRLEEALITVCTGLGLTCGRVDGRSGVWFPAQFVRGRQIPERKVAAIGVRVQRGVALHGFALNCNPSLEAFGRIVPCGIADAGVTSLSEELGREVTVDEVIPTVTDAVTAALDGALEVTAHVVESVKHVNTTSTSAHLSVPPSPRVSSGAAQFTTTRFGA